MKNTITFCGIWRFSGEKKGPKPNEEEIKGQVRTKFLKVPPFVLTCHERILVVAVGKLELFQL